MEKSKQSEDSTLILPDDPIIAMMDSLINSAFFQAHAFSTDSNELNIHGFCHDSVPEYDPQVYRERLEKLDAATPFNLVYNDKVKAFINLYTVKKRELSKKTLGMAHVYFPLFEETLDRYDLPLEFKYLAVVESALNPTARSRSGAVGLWQFMYRTGIIYDLHVSSYLDDRRNPYKSTVAACEYFQFLYKIFGNWELVLAAYNCGPGTVSRAIRRSGNKTDYWELWPYLPKETRGYVPAFIAVNYMMNYPAEHNLYPIAPKTSFFRFDTVHVNQMVTFEQISGALDIPVEELEYLNPAYKTGIIPFTGKANILCLPSDKTGLFVQNEAAIYRFNQVEEDSTAEEFVVRQVRKTHIVRKGEYLGLIAKKHNCHVSDIKDWNSMRSSRIYPGQRLAVYVTEKVPVSKPQTESADQAMKPPVYYTVQAGDTLWGIAKHKGLTVTQLMEMNRNVNSRNLKPGTKIIVGSGS